MLLKCPEGNNSNITQHDDIGNLEMKSDTRGNISTKDADHCASSATDHGGIFQGFGLFCFNLLDLLNLKNLIEHICNKLSKHISFYKAT